MDKIKAYLCRRFEERSFWVGIGTALSGVAVLPVDTGWKVAIGAAGIIASLVPDGKVAS